MSKEKERNKQTIKFLKWINKYPGWWHLICTPKDEHMNIKMMKLLLEKLTEESFYEIIFVLLMVHRNESFMEGLYPKIMILLVIKELKAGREKKIFNEVILHFN